MELILFQGDSITDSSRHREYDDARGHGYVTTICGALGAAQPYKYDFLNRGISGNRIVDLLARIRRDMINLKPDYMSILIGVNDVWHELDNHDGVDAKRFEHLYDLLIEQLLEELPNLKIMILEPFVVPGRATDSTPEQPDRWETFDREVRLRAAAAKRIAQKYNLTFVPLQDMFTKVSAEAPDRAYWIRDGVHPTICGHDLIKQEWLKAFEQLK